MIEDLKKQTSELRPKPSAGVEAGVHGAGHHDRRGRRRALEAQAALDEGRRRDQGRPTRPPARTRATARAGVGDRVVVGGLGLEGVVTSARREADVDVRGKRMRARVRTCGWSADAPQRREAGARVERQRAACSRARRARRRELNVIGCTVDEALARTERFLDETLMTELRDRALIHGHGTGQLRRAIAEFLQDHPLVASFQPAPPDQGGGGVTVVELKDVGYWRLVSRRPFIDDVRLQADIVQVVQELRLAEEGRARPTRAVPVPRREDAVVPRQPRKGFFHCFGCGVGGDVFKFVELQEKVGFGTR